MNAVKKRFSSGSSTSKSTSPKLPISPTNPDSMDGLSPELIPIVTLLSSQSHRRYQEGIFMLYYDLNGDGKPADREWKEVYGILTGNQLAYWDAAFLNQFKNNPDALFQTSTKPAYLNFTDSVYNAMKSLPAAKQNLDNVIIVSTTLKNRYILQFKSYKDLSVWYSALRLSNYEYSSLQEAYTGALLSARGSRLSDIRTVLAEKRFDHEDWVSIRYGSGMAWKRCFAVVEPSQTKRKSFTPGRILFFENDQKKKKSLMAVVTNCTSVTAIYPESPALIDHSTMLKLEGYINFSSPSLSTKVSKKEAGDFKHTSIFLMPEQHSSVPGFDTLIRFLIPLFDSFGLYGRPKKLKANRTDPESLLFGLPTLPRVHYLELEDISQLTNSDFLSWDNKGWTNRIKQIMKSKLDRGYEGCGSRRGYSGALNSLNSPLSSPRVMSSPKMTPKSQFSRVSPPPGSNLRQESSSTPPPPPSGPMPVAAGRGLDKNVKDLSIGGPAQIPRLHIDDKHGSVQLADIYQKYHEMHLPDHVVNDRKNLLNGGTVELIEEELPAGFRQLDLNKNVYPANDNELFSEEEEEEDDDDDDKIDVSRIGMSSKETVSSDPIVAPARLSVPQNYDLRSASNSSVISPMAQFDDLKEQYKQVERAPYLVDSPEPSPSPPPVPPHTAKLSHLSETISNVNQGTTTTEQTSIHSHAGRVSQISSSESQESFTKEEEVLNPYPVVPPAQYKPRHISSPNTSQNQSPRFSPELKHADPVYPVSPPLDDIVLPSLPDQASPQRIQTSPQHSMPKQRAAYPTTSPQQTYPVTSPQQRGPLPPQQQVRQQIPAGFQPAQPAYGKQPRMATPPQNYPPPQHKRQPPPPQQQYQNPHQYLQDVLSQPGPSQQRPPPQNYPQQRSQQSIPQQRPPPQNYPPQQRQPPPQQQQQQQQQQHHHHHQSLNAPPPQQRQPSREYPPVSTRGFPPRSNDTSPASPADLRGYGLPTQQQYSYQPQVQPQPHHAHRKPPPNIPRDSYDDPYGSTARRY
ncbi:uncharacterized protein SPAPADRAFT_153375, partial [Spathaspora passalidarum NRRL Y-27907]